ncbi:hypothetical protein Busp01_24550 [Trinickia caryophylli]|nr:hypothetical protein Busp01_24550 [Trinickia caryophylli]
MLLALFAVPPTVVGSHDWMLAYLAQTAVMIVLALSYNLLLGETGLLSFGHAAYAGLAAFVAAHAFNRYAIALPLLPLVGGAAAAALALPFGFVATRRAGTAFAMITLGIGELAAAAVWALPDGFGGAAGVSIDRMAGPAWGRWTFGPAREAYWVVAVWCLFASAALWALTCTPLARVANAVRDNAARVAALGTDPRRVRHAMVVLSAFFAGVAGTLGLIDIELASAEGVGMARSASVLIATVIGGSQSFFGPVLGAIVLTGFGVALAPATRAWPFYLGLLFIAVVMRAPDGLVGAAARHRRALAHHGSRAMLVGCSLRAAAVLAWIAALVLIVETLYARQFAFDETGAPWRIGGLRFEAASPVTWGVAAGLLCIGAAAARAAQHVSATRTRAVARGRQT